MEVTQKHRGFCACDDKDNENQEKEPKHVVHLVGPDRVQDEKELDEDAAEWQDAAHHNSWYRLRVDRLFRYESWYLVGPHRVLQSLKHETVIK